MNTSDNAFYLFNYFYNLNYKCFFILSHESKNIKNIINVSSSNNVVYYRSIKYYFIIQRADYIMFEQFYYLPFCGGTKLDYKIRGKKIFIQHSVGINAYKHYYNKNNFDLYCVSTKEEQKFIMLMTNCDSNKIVLTGLARFDDVFENSLKKSKIIAIMPTWRRWIKNEDTANKSEYVKKWYSLLKNSKLINYCNKHSYKVVFYPHYLFRIRMGNYLNNLFKIEKKFSNWSTRDFLINCNLLVTDYSSVAFDVAYQMKPTFYYQFDEKKFFKEHVERGYYDYKNGIGYYFNNENALVDKIIYVLEHGIGKNLERRIKKTFFKIDNHNCERIFKEVVNL